MNRQLVTKLLKKIYEYTIRNKINENGVLIYAGINEFGDEIFEVIESKICITKFYYNCGKKFVIDRFRELFESVNGYIIFANGNTCIIYKFDNTFNKIKYINANLIKRHKKGGQSSVRFARLAEESRYIYVTHIVDTINLLCNDKHRCVIFGSNEIVNMIITRNDLLVDLKNGGFIDFNDTTINNTDYWIKSIKNNDEIDDKKINEIILYLDTNVNMLDFDIENKETMKYYFDKEMIETYKSHKLYRRICDFEYIGVKFYEYEND